MRAAGLPRPARLRRAADFVALRQASGRLGGRCFSVRYRPSEQGLARLGLAVSKRVSKRAVERNRIKRLVRESFRRMRAQLPPLDVMVMAREQAAGQPGPVLLAELEQLWRRLAALKPPQGAGTIER
ncbi:ribonuclease P protein component [Fulvimonas soli]|jgi:ribonuclease P protein component|uniref:Ribonuclease P protein component n=1 Tax=Fulvimonas soli TaxID=155197 RepID=A0A316IZ64_9GAMM|nr:ribonuclease P protein component [Fulvimonas soli]PWK92535.1 ribonuclease P protein component [Fulvimonas soli]TNY27746.1 ribonuclease P protein component [Fulvimonas soli]